MRTKAQVTVWILLAIVILVVYGIANSKPKLEIPSSMPLEVEGYQDLVHNCFEKNFQETISLMGISGRLDHQDMLNAHNGQIEIFIRNDKIQIPELTKLEIQAEKEIQTRTLECVDQALDTVDYNIDESLFDILFTNTAVIGRAEIPVTINFGDKEYQFEEFFTSLPVRMPLIFSSVQDILRELQKNMDYINTKALSLQPFEVKMFNLDDNNFYFELTDNYKAYEYTYRFAAAKGGSDE